MDGKTALIYARSRETTSDFDRSRRQSVVIQAMLQKAKSQNLFESITKIDGFLEILGSNFKSNFTGLSEMFEWYNLIKQSDLSTDFLRVIWEDGNGFLCSSSSPETGYIIKYCGGAIAGRNVTSASRTKAKNNIQNLLDVAESKTLFDVEVAVIGNSSTEASKIRDELKEAGFANIKFNNLHKNITKSSKNIPTKTTVYIADTALRAKFAKLDLQSKYQLDTVFPTSKELPKGFENAKIAVWIENAE